MRFLVLLLLGVSPVFVGNTHAEILFEDDFETGRIDPSKWASTPGWTVVDNTDAHLALGAKVLDVWGGDEGLSTDEFPEEFDYYADFKVVGLFDIQDFGQVAVAGFIFHAQNIDNLYMHQASVAGDDIATPQHMRWHRRFGGTWEVEPLPFADGSSREADIWYRIKFEVRKNHFRAYLGDVGALPSELSLVGEWTDTSELFTRGRIGFRAFSEVGAGEHFQVDNVSVETPNQITSIDSKAKLTTTWGSLKNDR